MRVAIVSGQYPPQKYSEITRIITRDYARQHGYDFYYFQKPVPVENGAGPWSIYYTKIAYLLEVMKSNAHDLVVWFDADVLICETDRPLERVADLRDSSIDRMKPRLRNLDTYNKYINLRKKKDDQQ
jgi:hypothetical protein